MIRIENDYKVNQNHHFSNKMTSDLVQEMVNGKLIWIVYLFAANAVTPLRVMEFDSCDLAEDWAVVQGSKLHTYFGLGLSDECGDCTDDKLCEKHYPFDNADTRSNEEIANDLWKDSNPENCDGCANQESIAAPGEITKCREHQEKVISDDEHYASMRKFFNENLMDLEFNSYLPYCSQCGKKDPAYVGMMRAFKRDFPLTFAFCVKCHDDLVRRADAAKQSSERFGV